MIMGVVNADYEAMIQLDVYDSTGQAHAVEAVIDTGFNGFLTLPPAFMTVLGLTRLSRGRAQLANGSEEIFDIYRATILWDGQSQHVEADAVDTIPLVGMALLDGYDLHIKVAPGGQVLIQAMESDTLG